MDSFYTSLAPSCHVLVGETLEGTQPVVAILEEKLRKQHPVQSLCGDGSHLGRMLAYSTEQDPSLDMISESSHHEATAVLSNKFKGGRRKSRHWSHATSLSSHVERRRGEERKSWSRQRSHAKGGCVMTPGLEPHRTSATPHVPLSRLVLAPRASCRSTRGAEWRSSTRAETDRRCPSVRPPVGPVGPGGAAGSGRRAGGQPGRAVWLADNYRARNRRGC